jgi:hypothetical protein
MAPLIDKYAKEHGAGLVIDNSKPWPEWPTVWVGATTDITKKLVEIYNTSLTVLGSMPGK